jgi:hypothetical protein
VFDAFVGQVISHFITCVLPSIISSYNLDAASGLFFSEGLKALEGLEDITLLAESKDPDHAQIIVDE